MKTTSALGLNTFRTPMHFAACAALLLGLAACAQERPQSSTTRGLDTGITSSFGGADQTLGTSPNIGITTPVSR